jgi:hypothetical protein
MVSVNTEFFQVAFCPTTVMVLPCFGLEFTNVVTHLPQGIPWRRRIDYNRSP